MRKRLFHYCRHKKINLHKNSKITKKNCKNLYYILITIFHNILIYSNFLKKSFDKIEFVKGFLFIWWTGFC